MRRSGSAIDTQPAQSIDAAAHAEEDMLLRQRLEGLGYREMAPDLRLPEFLAGLPSVFVFLYLNLAMRLVEQEIDITRAERR